MSTLSCLRCGVAVCTVRDDRFGLVPSGTLCLRCSHPAHR